MNHVFEVNEGAAGERLDVFLANQLEVSRSRAQSLLKTGGVQVDGRTQTASHLVKPHERIIVTTPENAPEPEISTPVLPIVYEDDDVLVIDKPAHITVHDGSGTVGQATVADFARQHTSDPDPERPGIVHRLDRDTSGLMIIAKTPQAKIFLQEQFKQRKVHKTYRLLTVGHVEPAHAIIRLPLDRDPKNPLRRAVVPGGREAITSYHTLASYPGYTYLEAQPATGRTHQLRVHFAALGHPIAGDTTYGPSNRPLGLTRQFLHAAALEFVAPSGKTIRLVSPLPPELQKVLAL